VKVKVRSVIKQRLGLFARSERGQALVETAVSGFLLILFILGVGEFGKVIYASIEVSNAAMAGVQYGAQSATSATDATGIQNAAQAAAPDLTGLTATSSTACICSSSGTSVVPSACASLTCATGAVEQVVTVNTQVTVNPIIHLTGMPSSFTLNGQAVQKCNQ
jgi:Flp pilus assembly protein TadG